MVMPYSHQRRPEEQPEERPEEQPEEWCVTDWRSLAACRRYDTEFFFPEKARDKRRQIARAKAVCARCPVREECLRLAMERGEPVGIWGGLTVAERRNLRRRARRAARLYS